MVRASEQQGVQEYRVAVSDDGGDALRQALTAAAAWTGEDASRSARVVLAEGVHRISPVDAVSDEAAIVISDAARLTIDGTGSELLFDDPHRGGIDLRRSHAVTLRGFTVDYAEPSFTQGTIRAVDHAAGTFDFVPAVGYPDFGDRVLFTGTGYGTLRDAGGGSLKSSVRQTFLIDYETTASSDGSFRVTVQPSDRAWMFQIEEGDGFVVGHRGDRHGIRIDGCERITLRDVTIHAAPCAAVLAHESSALLLERLTVARRAGSSRWISTNADAVHCQGGRRGPQIVGCRFEGMHDDGVNLYVHARPVAEVRDGRTIVLEGGGPMAPGDVLQFVDAPSGAILDEVAVQAVVPGEPAAVRLVHPLPDSVTEGAAVYNRSNALPGFRIDDCRFHDFRGIGVRLKASSGIVADSVFERLSGCALWIANDPGWSEGPLGSHDVEIVGNRFTDAPGDASLQSWPHSSATVMIELFSGDDGPATARGHERITVRDNDIAQTARTAVFVGGAAEVVIEDLRVRAVEGAAWLGTRDSDVRVGAIEHGVR